MPVRASINSSRTTIPRFTNTSVAAATAARSTRRTTRAFARVVNVVDIGTRNRVGIERHDLVRHVIALVGLDPRLDAAAAQHTAAERRESGARYCTMNSDRRHRLT